MAATEDKPDHRWTTGDTLVGMGMYPSVIAIAYFQAAERYLALAIAVLAGLAIIGTHLLRNPKRSVAQSLFVFFMIFGPSLMFSRWFWPHIGWLE